MGVKEYRFLTKTMKTITTRSNKLEKANSLLTKTENDLKDSRASARSARSKIKRREKSLQSLGEKEGALTKEINATKKELESKKAEIPFYIPNVLDEEEGWGFWKYVSGFVFFCIFWTFFMTLLVFRTETVYWSCSDGVEEIQIEWVNDGMDDCDDDSDEGVQLSAEEEIIRDDARNTNRNIVLLSTILGIIITIIVQRKRSEIGFEKYSPVDELLSKLHALNNRQRTSKKENKKRGKKKFELDKLKKELSELESDIEDSVKLRDSTKKEIKLLEKEIAPLWDSIAHLIPFSNALENA